MELSVVVRAREEGARPEETISVARIADDLGYRELWIGEGPGWDAFVLATAVGIATKRAALTVGPVPVSVRDPATISRGAASVASVIDRPVGVALGTASVRVVEKLHGRSRHKSVTDLRESARAIRELIDGTAQSGWQGDPDARFLRRLGTPSGPVTVAAFGDRAIQIAADYADRMLLDLVTTEQVAALRSKLERSAGSRTRPKLAAWLPAAVDPTEESLHQVLESIAGYLTIGGYREMFLDAGFGEAVERARSGAEISEVVEALPDDAAGIVGLVGDRSAIGARLEAYAEAGLDEVAIVPVTAGDSNGERTLGEMQSLVR